jgi:hypothetical protein
LLLAIRKEAQIREGLLPPLQKIRDLEEGRTTCWICGHQAYRLNEDEPVIVAVGDERIRMTIEEAEISLAAGNKVVGFGGPGGDIASPSV